jgi:putative transposase
MALMSFYKRKWLRHTRPSWVDESDPVFITFVGKIRRVNQFASPECWKSIVDTIDYLEKQKICIPMLLLAMPDHIHMLIMVSSNVGIRKFILKFKRVCGYGRGIQWQRGAFDHRIRNKDSYVEKWEYILLNPVRAGLVTHQDFWPYVKIWKRDG